MPSNTYIKKVKFVKDLASKKGCSICGERNPIFLDFDHIDPETKRYKISSLYSYSWDNIFKELNKCRVLCTNCHYLHTHNSGIVSRNMQVKRTLLINKTCEICNEEDFKLLEFDHIDSNLKNKNISNILRRTDILKEELQNCQVLCKKCHRIKTCIQLDWYHYIPDLRHLWITDWARNKNVCDSKQEMLGIEQILYADFGDYF